MRVYNKYFHIYKFKNTEPIHSLRKLKKYGETIHTTTEEDLKKTIKETFPTGSNFMWREEKNSITVRLDTTEYNAIVENEISIAKSHSKDDTYYER